MNGEEVNGRVAKFLYDYRRGIDRLNLFLSRGRITIFAILKEKRSKKDRRSLNSLVIFLVPSKRKRTDRQFPAVGQDLIPSVSDRCNVLSNLSDHVDVYEALGCANPTCAGNEMRARTCASFPPTVVGDIHF